MRALLFFLLMLPGLSWGQTGIPPWPSGGLPSTSYPFNSSGNLLSTYLGTPTFYWDFSQTVAATVVADSGQTMTQGGTGTTRVADATWPNGISSAASGYAYRLNGSGYFTSAITVANLTGATGKMSGIAIVTPATVSGYGIIACNWHTGGTAGWVIWRATTGYQFIVSDNGEDSGATHVTTVSVNTSAAVGKMSVVGWSYDPTGGDGAATMKVWVDSATEGSSTTANGPIYTSASAMEVGTTGGGSNFSGWIHGMMIQPTTMTATQFAYLRDTYRGKMGSKGSAVTTTWATPGSLQLAPADSGIEPFIIDMPVGGTMVGKVASGSGGIAAVPAVTNLLYRSKICATPTGGHPTGWNVFETAGDGASAIDCVTTTSVDGTASLAIANTGTTSYGYVCSNCTTTGVGADLSQIVYAKKSAGTSKIYIWIDARANSDCTGAATNVEFNDSAGAALSNKNCGTTWTKYYGIITAARWPALRPSYRVCYENDSRENTVYFDAPVAYAGSEDVAYSCTSDADATTACTSASHAFPSNPLTTGNWTITGVFRMPTATPAISRYLVTSGSTGGAPNYPNIVFCNVGTGSAFMCGEYDGADDGKYVTSSVSGIAANTDYSYTFSHTINGTIYLKANTTVGTNAGTGTGIMTGVGTLQYGVWPANSWTRDLKFFKRAKR